MSHGHFLEVCSCGIVIRQCRCMSPDKVKRILPHPACGNEVPPAVPVRPAPLAGTILLGEIGSRAYLGQTLPGSDSDQMGVMIEGPESVIGLTKVEQVIHRSAQERGGDVYAPAQPGDLERTTYTLRKFCKLALKGNPTVLSLLWSDPIQVTPIGEELILMRGTFASRLVVKVFLGYMQQQMQRLDGERGQRGVNRPALVEAHGYDTKYASHILRLGYQGLEYTRTGGISIPLQGPALNTVMAVRRGNLPETIFRNIARDLLAALEEEYQVNRLGFPKEPNRDYVSRWLTETHLRHWKSL